MSSIGDVSLIKAQIDQLQNKSIALSKRAERECEYQPTSRDSLSRQIESITKISTEAQALYEEMEAFKTNQAPLLRSLDLRVMQGFNMIQQGCKTLSKMAEEFKKNDVPRAMAALR